MKLKERCRQLRLEAVENAHKYSDHGRKSEDEHGNDRLWLLSANIYPRQRGRNHSKFYETRNATLDHTRIKYTSILEP
jgi:hypothetical protein